MKRLIKAPKLYVADTGLLCHLLGFRVPHDLPGHALWGAVWGNFVVSETRKRLLDTGRRAAHSCPPAGACHLHAGRNLSSGPFR